MDYNELAHMTVIKLREEAKKFPDAKGVTGMKKDELIHFLCEKHGIEIPAKTPHKVKSPRRQLDKKTLKQMIAELKAKRDEARGKNDTKQVDILRRRIHLLKRRTRTAA